MNSPQSTHGRQSMRMPACTRAWWLAIAPARLYVGPDGPRRARQKPGIELLRLSQYSAACACSVVTPVLLMWIHALLGLHNRSLLSPVCKNNRDFSTNAMHAVSSHIRCSVCFMTCIDYMIDHCCLPDGKRIKISLQTWSMQCRHILMIV